MNDDVWALLVLVAAAVTVSLLMLRLFGEV